MHALTKLSCLHARQLRSSLPVRSADFLYKSPRFETTYIVSTTEQRTYNKKLRAVQLSMVEVPKDLPNGIPGDIVKTWGKSTASILRNATLVYVRKGQKETNRLHRRGSNQGPRAYSSGMWSLCHDARLWVGVELTYFHCF